MLFETRLTSDLIPRLKRAGIETNQEIGRCNARDKIAKRSLAR